MAIRAGALGALPLLFAALSGHAVQLYKSTGPDGRVTYSDVPPAASTRAEVVTVDTSANAFDAGRSRAPSAARQPATAAAKPETVYEQIIRRRTVVDDREVKAAEKALEAARSALRNAQENSTAEDWIYAGGRWGKPSRFPTPEYAARIEALEKQVKQSEEALAEAERRLRLAS
jgi:hypothetical protein